ncbi:MAG: hypothetical protein SWC40_04250 [Thermodesulfobacteriota bacterium]|nr:hypothetical protein [Thermodesulfobacteriota bacterium]
MIEILTQEVRLRKALTFGAAVSLSLVPKLQLEAVPKPELGNEGKDHFEILARSLERQRVSAVAGGKLELPSQGVPKLELGNEG